MVVESRADEVTLMESIPFPGSPHAVAQGCTCPVMDNNHGAGVDMGGSSLAFWYHSTCPIHGYEDAIDAPRGPR